MDISRQVIKGARDGAFFLFIVKTLIVIAVAFTPTKAGATYMLGGDSLSRYEVIGGVTYYGYSSYNTGGGLWIFTKLYAM